MKTILSIAVGLSLAAQALTAQTLPTNLSAKVGAPADLLDSTYYWKLDTVTNTYTPTSRIIGITYDANNNQTSYISQSYTNGTWVNYYQILITYGANNKITSFIDQNYTAGAWVNNNRKTYAQDANGNEILNQVEKWVSGAWEGVSKSTNVYNGNNRITSGLYETWANSAWQNASQGMYTYTNNSVYTRYEQWANNAWVISYTDSTVTSATGKITYVENYNYYNGAVNGGNRYVYTYNANDDAPLIETYSFSQGMWNNASRSTFTYDNNHNALTYINEYYNAGVWNNSAKSTYTYDASNNQISTINQNYTNNAWENTTKTIRVFNANNAVINNQGYKWLSNTWVKNNEVNTTYDTNKNKIATHTVNKYIYPGVVYTYTDSVHWYYRNGPTKLANNTTNTTFSSYPNPSNGTFTIDVALPTTTIITNMLGQVVYNQLLAQGATTITLPNAKAGVYVVRASNATEQRTYKINIE